MKRRAAHGTRGFTLTEILVVLAVMAVLVGAVTPIARNAIARSREAACLGNLRGLGTALESYLQDHNQTMPELVAGRTGKSSSGPVLETVLLPYLDSEEAFHCPQDRKQFAESGSSYFWNSTQSGKLRTELRFFGNDEVPERIPLIFDKEAWHPSATNFLYADLSSSNKLRFIAGN